MIEGMSAFRRVISVASTLGVFVSVLGHDEDSPKWSNKDVPGKW